MNIYLGANKLSNIDVIINNSLRSLLISTNMINNVQVYADSIYWLTVDHFSLESPHSKLSIHYVSKISEKRIDSKISESNAIEFIKDDAVKNDKSYRQRVDVSF